MFNMGLKRLGPVGALEMHRDRKPGKCFFFLLRDTTPQTLKPESRSSAAVSIMLEVAAGVI